MKMLISIFRETLSHILLVSDLPVKVTVLWITIFWLLHSLGEAGSK